MNSTKARRDGSRSIRPSTSPSDGSHPWRAIVGKQLCQGWLDLCLLLGYSLLTVSLACLDPLLRNKSLHGRSRLCPPPDPRHLPRSPALRNTNNSYRRLSLLALHLPCPPARAPRAPHLPAAAPFNSPAESCWSSRILGATRRAAAAAFASQN